jgi:hypothetical protein
MGGRRNLGFQPAGHQAEARVHLLKPKEVTEGLVFAAPPPAGLPASTSG